MSEIRPFRAVIYNQEKIRDLSRVVCPPYDVISTEAQERYHKAHANNLINILLGKDAAGDDKYRRAGVLFHEWLKQEVMVQDDTPAVYFYSHQYKIRGETRVRLGFIALLRLADKNSSVYAHEHTRPAPKEDRLRLLRQVKANLSPIFAVFRDEKRIIQRAYRNYVTGSNAFLDVIDEDKNVHKMWRIADPKALAMMQSGMLEENVFIADGHHRYETACAFRDEMRQNSGGTKGDESFNYIMAYFTNTDPRGLLIMPIHRLARLDKPLDMDAFKENLQEYFALEEFRDKDRFFFLMEKGGRTEHLLGVYRNRRYWLLRLKNIKILDKIVTDKPAEYRCLDVSILNAIIFNKIMGYTPETNDSLTYTPHAEECINKVNGSDEYIAFFLNPVKVEQIMAVALKGERMPPKSTYFYPKVLSGLVINKLE